MPNKFIHQMTHRQNEIFSFLQHFAQKNGFAPSIREIGEYFHIAPSSTLDHLKALEKKGYIKRVPAKPRCLEVLKRLGETSL